jgi:hypothetical protein
LTLAALATMAVTSVPLGGSISARITNSPEVSFSCNRMELPSGLMGCAYHGIANGQDEFIHAERVDVVIKDALLPDLDFLFR